MSWAQQALENPRYAAVTTRTGNVAYGVPQFLNLISRSNEFAVGDGLGSCTSEVTFARTTVDGAEVALIDTPGFDDTNVSDTDLLKMICHTLSMMYVFDVGSQACICTDHLSTLDTVEGAS